MVAHQDPPNPNRYALGYDYQTGSSLSKRNSVEDTAAHDPVVAIISARVQLGQIIDARVPRS